MQPSAGVILEGVALAIGGVLIAACGVAMWRDVRGLTSSYYYTTIKSWEKMGCEFWIWMTPFKVFRLEILVGHVLIGGILVFAGVAVIFNIS